MTEWMNQGRCLGDDPELWFPNDFLSAQYAIKTCAFCLVRKECADYAQKHRIRDGVWGGSFILSGRIQKR